MVAPDLCDITHKFDVSTTIASAGCSHIELFAVINLCVRVCTRHAHGLLRHGSRVTRALVKGVVLCFGNTWRSTGDKRAYVNTPLCGHYRIHGKKRKRNATRAHRESSSPFQFDGTCEMR